MSVGAWAILSRGEKRGALLRGLGQTPWALLDQMLISATNFITIILLARGFSPAALGSFTLVYSFLLFVNTLQAGLVTQPHNILGATRRGDDYVRFTTSTALSQLLLAGGAALLAVLAWAVARLLGWQIASLLLALAPAIIAWQSQEFVRRVLYTEGRLPAALANDLIGYGGQALAIAILWWADELTGPRALHALAVFSALGAVVGGWKIRHSLRMRLDTSAFAENWHFGKWVAGGEIFGHWLSAQLFVYLAAAMLGAAAAGVLRAIHTIFGPARILADVFCTMLPIRFARTLADGGKGALHRQLKGAYVAAVPLLGGYCLLVAGFAGPILRLLYGQKYTGYAWVLTLYAVAAFISYLTMVVAAALRAKRQTRQVFMTQVYSSLIALPIGWGMIAALGIQGIALGMIVSYLAMMLLLLRIYRREHYVAAAMSIRAEDGPATPACGLGTVRQQLRTRPSPQLSAGVPPEADNAELTLCGPLELAAAPQGRCAGSGMMLMRILQVLDEAGIPYCVLHGYRTYPDSIASDVDCMMPADVLPHRLAAILQENVARTGARVVQWVHADTHYFVLAGRNPDGSVCFLQLDISIDYDLRSHLFYSGQEILQSRRRHGWFWIPSASVEFGCYLVRRMVKRSLSPQQQLILSGLYAQDPAGCHRQIARFWSGDSAGMLEWAAASGEWTQVRRRLVYFRRQLLRCSARRHPLALIARWLTSQTRRLHRWIWPRHGLSVVLLGPDGAGKSSVARAVRQDLAPAFFATTGRSFPPALLNRATGDSQSPHALPLRSPVASVIRAVFYWMVYQTAGYLVTVHKELARCMLVLHDRHLVDSIVDPKRYRYGGPIALLRAIWRVAPKPDLVILLDAPPQVVQARKQEVPLEETRRQLGQYQRLLAGIVNGRIVDAGQPLGRVVAEVDAILIRHLANRVARRLGMPPPLSAPFAVYRAISQFTGVEEHADWVIRKLGRGDQADIYSVRRVAGQLLWQEHEELVVKLYRGGVPASFQAARHEFDSLSHLYAAINGCNLHGWTICCPLPLHVCPVAPALIMTKVPGQSLNSWLESGDDAAIQSLHSCRHALVATMERYWAAEGGIYGDLDFNNILCDPAGKTLSLIDPGIPEPIYLCPKVPHRFYPASRDLAYMLFDVAASVKASVGRPRTGQRRRDLVEDILHTFLAKAGPAQRRQQLLEEITCCTRIHLGRIPVSCSPLGLGRMVVRRAAWRCIRGIVEKLRPDLVAVAGGDLMAPSDKAESSCSPNLLH